MKHARARNKTEKILVFLEEAPGLGTLADILAAKISRPVEGGGPIWQVRRCGTYVSSMGRRLVVVRLCPFVEQRVRASDIQAPPSVYGGALRGRSRRVRYLRSLLGATPAPLSRTRS
jgi:hypothetical protein